jgi:hypothetical protein
MWAVLVQQPVDAHRSAGCISWISGFDALIGFPANPHGPMFSRSGALHAPTDNGYRFLYG